MYCLRSTNLKNNRKKGSLAQTTGFMNYGGRREVSVDPDVKLLKTGK